MFDVQLPLGTLIIILSVIFHIIGLVYLSTLLEKVSGKARASYSKITHSICLLTVSVLVIIGLHTIEAWGWAFIYFYLGEFTDLQQALYFSVVTSTTLGYGDITLSENWQILGTFEAMGGLILFGTSTAFMIQLMRHLFEKTDK